ncbi:MAG: hypothetical protein J6T44_10275 [Prevotella sp.]|nr:hypothetical protein [Prevotella sp.]
MMKKYILTLMILLLAGANAAWGENVVKIDDTEYATLQAAINAVTMGEATTIEFISSNTAVSGDGFQIPDGTSGRNITIDFKGCTYTVTGGAVGSSGTINQCMHFASGNTLTLKNGTINVQENLSSIKIMMQNYCNLTLDDIYIDCSNVITQTYGPSYGEWEDRTRPVFNFNAGTSTITNSTITFNNNDQFGVLIDQEGSAGNLIISGSTTINGNVTALGGIATINNEATINGNVLVDKVEDNQATGTITINGGTINGSAQSKNGVSSLIIPAGSTAAFPNAVAKVLNTSNTARCYTTNFEDAFATVQEGETIELLKDAALTGDVTLDKSFNLDFKNYAINLNGHTIKLVQGATIKTNKQTNIFTAVDDDYIVTMENSGEIDFPYAYSEMININTANFTVTVAPITYDGLNHKIGGSNPVKVKIYDVVSEDELDPNKFEISMLPYTSYDADDFPNPSEDVYKYAYTYINAITIKGKPDEGYAGSITVDFVISPRNINDVTVKGHSQPYTETGYTTDDNETTGIKKLVTLKYNNNTLVVSTDYTIDVAANTYKNAGTYPEAITLTAVEGGNFTGTRKVDFTIGGDNDIAACNITATVVYNGSTQTPTGAGTTPTIIVRDGSTNALLVQDTDYELEVATYDYKDAQTYSGAVTIRGIGDYYNTKVVDYIITPKDIADCTINASTPFTGSVINPANVVTVQDGTTSLAVNTDYTLTVSNGYTYLNPQTYANAITVTGMKNYTGTVTKDFTITSANSINIADGKLLVTSNAIYSGKTQVPSTTTITVKYDGAVLDTEHYNITYAPNVLDVDGTTEIGYKDAQTYSRAITISAKGTTYYGSVTADYVIAPRNMNQVTATEVKKMTWTGENLTPIINGNNATTNINLTYDNYKLVANDTKMDYTYTSDPTPIKDPGTYTITFEGRGNFTGTKQLEVHVQKSIADATITMNIDKVILPNNTIWNSTWNDLPLIVNDGTVPLTIGTDYDVKVYSTEASANGDEDATDVVDGISTGGIFYARIIGKGNNYTNRRTQKFYVLNEYYGKNNNNNTCRADLHLTEVVSSDKVIAKFGNAAGSAVIDNTNVYSITAQPIVNCGSETIGLTLTGVEANAFKNLTALTGVTISLPTITEIANGAFTGCTGLRYIDLCNAKNFTPTSLERNIVEAPFYGVPRQALIYLNSTTIKGENYVYKPGDGSDYYCEKFKIYDDLSGSQTSFSETDGYKWAYENIHEFTAYTIENTRALTAGRHYTTCLPYDLPLPATLKAYTLKGTNTANTLIGFEEVTGTLTKYTPYVLIPSTSGQLLSTTNAVVQKPEESSVKTELGPATAGNFTMYGTMRYMDGPDAAGKYIMQYNNGSPTWKVISGSTSSYTTGVCILPMRAYISVSGSSGARTYLNAMFTDAEGNTTNIEQLRVDEEDGTIYDLQGRKQTSPTQKGIYIISNGRKIIVK